MKGKRHTPKDKILIVLESKDRLDFLGAFDLVSTKTSQVYLSLFLSEILRIHMNRPTFALGTGLFVVATLLAGTIHETAFADTVPVSIKGISYDFDYTGTNVSISLAEVDTESTILIFDVSNTVDLTLGGILEITIPRDAFDSKLNGVDDPFILVADGTEVNFVETETTSTSRTLNINLDAGTEELEIIGTVFNNESDVPEPAVDPPVPVDPTPVDPLPVDPIPVDPAPVDDATICTNDYVPVCGMDGVTYSNMCYLGVANMQMDYLGECIQPTRTTCGEGTILRDGLCIPACGAGLVLVNDICVIEQRPIIDDPVPVADPVTDDPIPDDPVPVADKAETAKSSGSSKDFASGAVAAFVVAFLVMIVLGLVARGSKSKS